MKILRYCLFRLNLFINKDKALEDEINLIRSFYPYKIKPIKLNENLDLKKLKFLFFIPPFNIGSGGHLNIFRFSNFLINKGAKVYIYIDSKFKLNNKELINFIKKNYIFPKFEFIDEGKIKSLSFNGVIYSSWETVYNRNKFIFEGQNFYFVQDYEPFFYNKGSLFFLAENSYNVKNMNYITAGSWIKKKLIQKGIDSQNIIDYDFAVDNEIYFPQKKNIKEKNILFYFRPGTKRRMASIGLRALELLAYKFPNIKIKLIGDVSAKIDSKFNIIKINTVPPEKLGDIYRSVNVVLVLGATNCSLLPLEVVACGTPVIINSGENNKWISKKVSSIIVSESDPYSLSSILENVVFHNYESIEFKAQQDAKSLSKNSWNDTYEPIWNWINKKYEKRNS